MTPLDFAIRLLKQGEAEIRGTLEAAQMLGQIG